MTESTGNPPGLWAAWSSLAACRDHPTVPFREWDDHGTNRAAAVCKTECPVRAHCLADAMKPRGRGGVGTDGGIRGGLSEDERRSLIRRGYRSNGPVDPDSPPKRANEVDPDDHNERLRLADLGWSNGAIAKACGVDVSTIAKWRRNNGIPPWVDPSVAEWEARGNRLRVLHAQGMTDAQMAAEEGVTRRQVRGWRDRNDIPVNPDPTSVFLTRIPRRELVNA